MKRITIETTYNRYFVARSFRDLKKDLVRENISLEIKSSESLKFLDEIAISIVGGVSVYVITRLIKILLSRIKPTQGTVVTLIDQSTNITFNFPDDMEKCIEFYKNPFTPTQTSRQDIEQLERMLQTLEDPTLIKGILSSLCRIAAQNNYFACKSLLRVVMNYNKINFDSSKLDMTSTIEGIYRSENIPIQLRLYSFGLHPVRDKSLTNKILAASREDAQSMGELDTKSFIRNGHPLAAELLKAYIISLFLAADSIIADIDNRSYNEIIAKIMTSTEFVGGSNVNADFKFGKDVSVLCPKFSMLMFVAGHEISHNILHHNI